MKNKERDDQPKRCSVSDIVENRTVPCGTELPSHAPVEQIEELAHEDENERPECMTMLDVPCSSQPTQKIGQRQRIRVPDIGDNLAVEGQEGQQSA